MLDALSDENSSRIDLMQDDGLIDEKGGQPVAEVVISSARDLTGTGFFIPAC